MKKTAQLLVNHLKGEKTPESKQIIKKIAGMLKEFGFQGPIKITKVSGILDLDDPVRDAYLKLGIIGENEDLESNYINHTNDLDRILQIRKSQCAERYGEGTPEFENRYSEFQNAAKVIADDFTYRASMDMRREREEPQIMEFEGA